MTALPLQSQVFTILRDLIEERIGLHFGFDDAQLLADKLSPRAIEAGFDSLLDYYYFLRYDPEADAELHAVANALVVNETYFFRELEPLRVLVEQVLRPLVASLGRARVWCAAASTGEEPLTLAMLLSASGLLPAVEVVASDLSTRALAQVQRGLHARRSIRGPVPHDLQRFLTVDDEGVRVNSALRSAIRWERVNLVEEREVEALGSFDVILCRNVLIYFSDQTTRTVVERLARRLRPGGRLVVGTSESLLRFGTSLVSEERGGAFFYRAAP